MQSQYHVRGNVEYKLIGKNGEAKRIFCENALWRFFNQKLNIFAPQIPFLFGRWSKHKVVVNLVTNAGLAAIASRINGSGSEAAFTYIAVGTGTTAANVTDTALQAEITTGDLNRAAASVTRTTTTVTDDTAQLVKSFSSTGSLAVTESGVLNAAGSGVLLCRQVFAPINVVNGDILQVTWKIQAD